MRYREPFTVYPRRLPSGRVVYYYQTYDDQGRRTAPRSTGKTSKGAARQVCYDLMRTDSLIPMRGQEQLFEDYAKGWWVWETCEYLAYRRTRRQISPRYAYTAHGNLKNHILPFFGKKRLKEITRYTIERWIITMQSKGLKNATINVCLSNFSIMLDFAVQKDLLKVNPAKKVTQLKNTSRRRDILSGDEVKALFNEDSIDDLWGLRMYYTANLLAACTGMRMGEVVGVRGTSLQDGYILVDKQYRPPYGLIDTKTKDTRQIPVPDVLMDELQSLREEVGEGYLFSITLGEKPVMGETINSRLRKAMVKIGISEEQQEERYISFHSWRHYFNTMLRSNNISDGKVQSLTGHKSKAMTEHYTHFKPEDYADVKAVQNIIVPFSRAG